MMNFNYNKSTTMLFITLLFLNLFKFNSSIILSTIISF